MKKLGLGVSFGSMPQKVVGNYAPPTWNVCTPNSGPEAGGTTVIVEGSDLVAGTQVSFGFTWVIGTLIDSQHISAVTPPGVGVVGTQLTAPDGQWCTGPAFTYVAAPVVSAITPNTDDVAGGVALTNIAGTGFQNGATATIGGVPVTSLVFVSSIKLTGVAPPGTVGAQDVVVTNPDTQNSGASGAGLFTYTSGGTFDPATLNLSGWWRANYGGAPWAANASAGASLANGDMVTNLSDPAVGAAQNGKTPADFDGLLNNLTISADATDLFTVGAGTIVALFKADTADAPDAGGDYLNAPIYRNSGADDLLTFTTAGIEAQLYSSGYVIKKVACTTGTYHLVMMRWDGTNLGVTLDSAAEDTVACGVLTALSGTGNVGAGYAALHFFDGKLLELMTSPVALTAGDFANIKDSYVFDTYALAL